PATDQVGPLAQHFGRVFALITSGCAVKTDVGELRRQFHWRMLPSPVVDAKPHIVTAQHIIDLRLVPRGIAELENAWMVAWQRLNKVLQPFGIHMPVWRKLK